MKEGWLGLWGRKKEIKSKEGRKDGWGYGKGKKEIKSDEGRMARIMGKEKGNKI